MNKYKEALQKIVDFKPTLKGIFIDDLIDEINSLKNIATEALQSESRMYSEEEVIGFGIWLGEKYWFNLSTYKWECRNEEGLYEVLDSKQLMELYRQSLKPKTEELKEGLKPCHNHPDVLLMQCGICNGTFPKSTKEQPSPSIEKKIEVTGQEQSSEVVKELNWLHNKLWELGWKGFTDIESERGALAFHNAYTQLKSNNHFEELEKWVREERYHYGTDINSQELINKLYQLKTKLQN